MKNLAFSSILTAVALAPVVLAQTQPAGQTKALSHAIHAVDDLDTTLAFYRLRNKPATELHCYCRIPCKES